MTNNFRRSNTAKSEQSNKSRRGKRSKAPRNSPSDKKSDKLQTNNRFNALRDDTPKNQFKSSNQKDTRRQERSTQSSNSKTKYEPPSLRRRREQENKKSSHPRSYFKHNRKEMSPKPEDFSLQIEQFPSMSPTTKPEQSPKKISSTQQNQVKKTEKPIPNFHLAVKNKIVRPPPLPEKVPQGWVSLTRQGNKFIKVYGKETPKRIPSEQEKKEIIQRSISKMFSDMKKTRERQWDESGYYDNRIDELEKIYDISDFESDDDGQYYDSDNSDFEYETSNNGSGRWFTA